MKSINTKQMKTGLALIENNFIVSNASLDLEVEPSAVTDNLKTLIRNCPVELFVYANKDKRGRGKIVNLTIKGREFFHYAKYFIESIEEAA